MKNTKMKYILSVLLLVVTCTMQAQSLESITYSSDGQSFTAYYAKPIKITPKTKTILIVHEWWGLNDYPKTRALQIAQEGNIGFCIDMYGTGKIVDNPTDAQILAGPFYQDPQLAYNRFMAGYNEALKIEGVDPSKVAAIVLSKAGAGATAQVTKKIENNHVTLNTGFVQGTREKMVFGVYRDGKEEPVCYVRVVSITRSSCRAEIGSIDFNRLARDKEGNYEKAFRADRILIDLIEAGMTVRSEN